MLLSNSLDRGFLISGFAVGNTTAAESDDEHFQRCWKRQDCTSCLAEDQCGWCPFVSQKLPRLCDDKLTFWLPVLDVYSESVLHSTACTRVRRRHLSALGRALGDPHETSRLPSLHHHEPDIHNIYLFNLGCGALGLSADARLPVALESSQESSGLVARLVPEEFGHGNNDTTTSPIPR